MRVFIYAMTTNRPIDYHRRRLLNGATTDDDPCNILISISIDSALHAAKQLLEHLL